MKNKTKKIGQVAQQLLFFLIALRKKELNSQHFIHVAHQFNEFDVLNEEYVFL